MFCKQIDIEKYLDTSFFHREQKYRNIIAVAAPAQFVKFNLRQELKEVSIGLAFSSFVLEILERKVEKTTFRIDLEASHVQY